MPMVTVEVETGVLLELVVEPDFPLPATAAAMPPPAAAITMPIIRPVCLFFACGFAGGLANGGFAIAASGAFGAVVTGGTARGGVPAGFAASSLGAAGVGSGVTGFTSAAGLA